MLLGFLLRELRPLRSKTGQLAERRNDRVRVIVVRLRDFGPNTNLSDILGSNGVGSHEREYSAITFRLGVLTGWLCIGGSGDGITGRWSLAVNSIEERTVGLCKDYVHRFACFFRERSCAPSQSGGSSPPLALSGREIPGIAYDRPCTFFRDATRQQTKHWDDGECCACLCLFLLLLRGRTGTPGTQRCWQRSLVLWPACH